MVIKAHTVSPGKAEGEAVVYDGSFSFRNLNTNTGTISAPGHPLEGKSLVNKVFVFRTGKGLTGDDGLAWMAKQRGNAPAAIICLESEPVLSGAVIASGIPTLDRPEGNIFALIETGDYVKVNATEGVIELVEK